MNIILKKFFEFILVCECLFFLLFYIFGPKGKTALWQVEQAQLKIQEDINQLENEKIELKQQVEFLQLPFAKEQIARQRLLMKKKDEQIYVRKI